MRVHINYEYLADGSRTAEITGDVEEWRAELKKRGITEHAFLSQGDQPRGSAPYGEQLRSLYSAMEQQFPLALETRSSPRVSVRDRHPVIDRRAVMAEHAKEIAVSNRRHNEEFREYLRDGKASLSFLEERAQSVFLGSAGGFIIPQDFYDKVLVCLKAYDGLFDAESVLRTRDGADYPVPLDDDSSNVAQIILESGTSVATDSVYGTVVFKAPTWRSGQVRASTELAADSFFDLEGLLAGSFGRRFARGIGAAHVATLLTSATLGVTAASASAVTADEVLSLVDSVDAALGAKGSFLMRLSAWTSILKLKASTGGNYMVDEYERDAQGRRTLFGFPVFISPSMGPLTTGQKSICFGDLSRFVRREAGSLAVQTLIERYAEFGQIAYEARWRVDGQLLKAANSPAPIKFLQQA